MKRGLTRSVIPLGREGFLLRLTLAQVVVVAPVAANDALAELCRLNVMVREKNESSWKEYTHNIGNRLVLKRATIEKFKNGRDRSYPRQVED